MGLLETFGFRKPVSTPKTEITAQYAPAIYDAPYGQAWGNYGFGGYNNYASAIDRQNAISVPAVSRCRNLIVNTVASIPLEIYSSNTGAELLTPSWLKQLDIRAPRSVTMGWIVDSLFFYGVAYLRVEEIYQSDLRPSRFEWIQNDRVSVKLKEFNSEVDYYMVNNERVPMEGLGSLITIQTPFQGLLLTSGRTIQSAIDIEKAASIASQTPMPSGYIKNTGADLPDQQVQGLLAAWKQARQNRSTAYLTQTLEFQTTSYSPKDMMYNEAAQFLATQIARACNVPAYMIDAEIFRSNTYQNVLDGRKEFMAYTLQPYISAIEDRFSLDDLTPRGQTVRFSVDETFLRADAVTRLTVIEKLLTLGLIDQNQARAMEDLAPEGENGIDINIQ